MTKKKIIQIVHYADYRLRNTTARPLGEYEQENKTDEMYEKTEIIRE